MTAQTPPMGWNSWDCFGAAVNEEQVKANADYIAENLKEYGWEYVVVDIQWYQPFADSHEYQPFSELVMDAFGRLIPAPNRFPSSANNTGFKKLAKYVHDRGLKFGIHIMRGMPRMAAHKDLKIKDSDFTAKQVADPNSICFWNPDMYGLKCESNEAGARAYYDSIFKMYASWGVDFVKVDDIAREYPRCRKEIELIHDAVKNCGRDIVLSLSPGPAPIAQAEHLKANANMWRITDDFWDKWELLLDMFKRAEEWCTHAGPGHWPDADMLPVGALRQDYNPDDRTRFTKDEQITMMSLWCMMRSPLMVGAHLPKNDEFTLKLLTNKEILDIEKTTHCAHQLYRTDSEIAWIAPSKNAKTVYVALFNISDKKRKLVFDLSSADLSGYADAKELWTGKKVPVLDDKVSVQINAHGAAVFRFDC
ncbi:MAG: glycoside hydrolase family 27 protein [Lachnospiraceae bacterium]|nr:glycoside hydrolase family 27 protein [Lachnospiraceae bacterium]